MEQLSGKNERIVGGSEREDNRPLYFWRWREDYMYISLGGGGENDQLLELSECPISTAMFIIHAILTVHISFLSHLIRWYH